VPKICIYDMCGVGAEDLHLRHMWCAGRRFASVAGPPFRTLLRDSSSLSTILEHPFLLLNRTTDQSSLKQRLTPATKRTVAPGEQDESERKVAAPRCR